MPLNKLYMPKVSGMFFQSYQKAMAESVVSGLTIKENLAGETVKFSWMSPIGTPSEFSGKRKAHRPIARDVTVTNKDYELTTEIPLKALERDENSAITRHMGEHASRMADLPWDRIIALIKNGETGTAYDGQNFFSASHAIGASGTQKNLLTSSEVSTLNVTTATAPTPEEMAVALVNVIGHMQGYLDEGGNPLWNGHKDYLVLSNYNLLGSISAAISANNLAGGRTNEIKSTGLNLSYRSEPRLYSTPSSASAVFYVAAVNHLGLAPFLMNEEKGVVPDGKDADSEFCYDTQHISFGTLWRGGFGYGEPLAMVKCTLD